MKSYKQIKTGKCKTDRLHRILMEEHIGRKLDKNEIVHHKNGNIFNNNLDNLEIMTTVEHSRLHTTERMSKPSEKEKVSRFFTGRKRSKEFIEKMSKFTLTSRHTAKLIADDVKDIRKMIRDKIPYWLIGFIYGVSPTNIYCIKKGKSWSWLK